MEFLHDPSFDVAFDHLFAIAERVALRVVGYPDAEDVAAEALARTFARWSRVRDLSYRDAWVARVAVNEALDMSRRRRRLATDDAEVGSDVADDATTRVAIIGAIALLPKRQRAVVALRYLADLSETDTAEVLGISVGTVKQHTRRALTAMRGHLGPTSVIAWEG